MKCCLFPSVTCLVTWYTISNICAVVLFFIVTVTQHCVLCPYPYFHSPFYRYSVCFHSVGITDNASVSTHFHVLGANVQEFLWIPQDEDCKVIDYIPFPFC